MYLCTCLIPPHMFQLTISMPLPVRSPLLCRLGSRPALWRSHLPPVMLRLAGLGCCSWFWMLGVLSRTDGVSRRTLGPPRVPDVRWVRVVTVRLRGVMGGGSTVDRTYRLPPGPVWCSHGSYKMGSNSEDTMGFLSQTGKEAEFPVRADGQSPCLLCPSWKWWIDRGEEFARTAEPGLPVQGAGCSELMPGSHGR